MHLRFAVVTLASLVIVSGCSSGDDPKPTGTLAPGFNQAIDHVVTPGGPDGGVLRLVSTRGCGEWLPEQAISPWCVNMQRLVTRQLMTYGPDAGRLGAVVVADLAAGAGRPNEDRTRWTYELRSGVRWENGDPITLDEVAEGIRALDEARRDVAVVEITPESATSLAVIIPAISICDNNQPPKISPLALVSLGMATVCRARSPWGRGVVSISLMSVPSLD